LEPDFTGSGAFMVLYGDNTFGGGWLVDGNSNGLGDPVMFMQGTTSGNSLSLNMGAFGDASVVLPTDAVSAPEILDEPGIVASPVSPLGFPVGGAPAPINGVTLVAPAPGFAIILVEAEFNATAPPNTAITASLTNNGPIVSTWAWDAGDIDGFYDQHQTRIITQPVAAPGPYTYTLLLSQAPFVGGVLAGASKISAIYLPTAYGGFAAPSPEHAEMGDAKDAESFNSETERGSAVASNQARIDREMAAMKAQIEALKQRLDEQNRQGQLQNRSFLTPRKER
jgi:hypothetical protein